MKGVKIGRKTVTVILTNTSKMAVVVEGIMTGTVQEDANLIGTNRPLLVVEGGETGITIR